MKQRSFKLGMSGTPQRNRADSFRTQMRNHVSTSVLVIRVLSAAILASVPAAASARDLAAELISAQEKYGTGDLNGALQRLEPLLAATDLDQVTKERVREIAAQVLQSRGVEHFRRALIAESIADFERQIQLQPDQAAGHWQLGIAYYYANEYKKGSRQFELHKTVNPQDVENAAWHFLCVARAPGGSVAAAQKSLIDIAHDSRPPMAQIQKMFAGKATPEEVLKAGNDAGGTAKFYADLYVGLYYEALGKPDEALPLLKLAADNPAAKNSYMGDVARVHVALRKHRK